MHNYPKGYHARVPRWLPGVLKLINKFAAEGNFRLTTKAERETNALGLDQVDVREVLLGLAAGEFWRRESSRITADWLYIFKPVIGGLRVYLKIVLRDGCLVVSFHEYRGGDDEEIC